MDESTGKADAARAAAEAKDPRFRAAKAAGAGDRGREMLEHVVQGAELDDGEERSALDFLLGSPKAMEFDVEVQVDTDAGPKPLTFAIKAMDGRDLDAIEQRNRSQTTGLLNAIPANCEVVADATMRMVDHKGRVTDIRSDEFLTVMSRRTPDEDPTPHKLASPAMALERRFRYQLGLITYVAAEIRRVSGYDSERVGPAQRKLVRASLD